MTVPILTGQTNGDQVPSLCYEVHGKAEQYFNLISDTCTSVNAFYQKAENLSDNIDLNVVTKIGVRAVGGDNSTCKNIEVSLESCTVTVDGVVQGSDVYNNNGIRLRRTANANGLRVCISFSHAIGFCFDERSAALLSTRMRRSHRTTPL